MSSYVDELFNAHVKRAPRIKQWCHLMADTQAELDEMATQLGLKLKWKHGDHFDLTPEQRARAIVLGAKKVTARDLVNLRRRTREAMVTWGERPSDTRTPLEVLDSVKLK